jgi:hypothetical protein
MLNFTYETHSLRFTESEADTPSLFYLHFSNVNLSFLSLLSHFTDITSRISKDNTRADTRLNTWQQIRDSWGKVWWNRWRGRWHDRTSCSTTLPRSLQLRSTSRSLGRIIHKTEMRQFWQWVYLNPTCTLGDTRVGTGDRWDKQQYPSVH